MDSKSKFLKFTAMGMSEYASGILNWLGNRTYRGYVEGEIL